MGSDVRFQPPFTTPVKELSKEYRKANEVSVGNWLLTFLLILIPGINVIMVCVWSFSKNVIPSKRNFGAALVISSFVFYSLLFGAFFLLVVKGTIRI